MPNWERIEYKAPNLKTGFAVWQIQEILSQHSPISMVRVIVGWRGQIQRLSVITPVEETEEGPWSSQ